MSESPEHITVPLFPASDDHIIDMGGGNAWRPIRAIASYYDGVRIATRNSVYPRPMISVHGDGERTHPFTG